MKKAKGTKVTSKAVTKGLAIGFLSYGLLIGFIYWWMPKTKIAQQQDKTFKEILLDTIPKQYLQRFIIAMIIVMVRKFIMLLSSCFNYSSQFTSIFILYSNANWCRNYYSKLWGL